MRASGYDRVQTDYYVEPEWIVDALLDVEAFPGVNWDPACGRGNIPKTLEKRNLICLGSDLVDRGYGETENFFYYKHMSRSVENIISNPPYSIIEPFIQHALTLVKGKVAILARLAFLEGQARRHFFEQNKLSRVWVSSRRVSMPPGNSNVVTSGGSIAYAWFVWDKSYNGPPIIGWV